MTEESAYARTTLLDLVENLGRAAYAAECLIGDDMVAAWVVQALVDAKGKIQYALNKSNVEDKQ